MPILPVNQPIVTPYAHHTAVLSILANDDKHLPWIYTNYVQLVGFGPQTALIDFYNSCYTILSCPYLTTNAISRSTIKEGNNNLIQLFKGLIDNGNYVYAGIDGIHISAYAAHNQFRFQHPVFIYGYDDSQEIFYIADFFRHGMFKFGEASYREIEVGYAGLSSEDDFGSIINYFSYNKQGAYDFDPYLIRDILNDYLSSQVTADYRLTFDLSRINAGSNAAKPPLSDARTHWVDFEANRVFGISVYDIILSSLHRYVTEQVQFDARVFFIQVQHKKMILELLTYLKDSRILNTSYYDEEFRKLETSSRVVQSQVIKFRMTNKIHLMHEVIEMTKKNYKDEKALMEALVKDLTQALTTI